MTDSECVLQLLPDWVWDLAYAGSHYPENVPREYWREAANRNTYITSTSYNAPEPEEPKPKRARFKNRLECIRKCGR